MKKNSLISAASVLLAAALTVVGAAPAHAAVEAPEAVAEVTAPSIAINDVTANSASISAKPGFESGPVDAFEIEVSGANYSSEQMNYNDGASVFNDLQAGSKYTVTVTAVNRDSSASSSEAFSTLTLAPALPTLSVNNITATGADVTVGSEGEGGATDSYTVSVTNMAGDYSSTDERSAPGVLNFGELLPDTDYRVSAIARGPGGESFSSTQFRTTLPAPATPFVTVGEIGFDTVELAVVAGEDGGPVTSYTVNVYNADGSFSVSHVLSEPGVVNLSGLLSEVDYTADVIADGPGGKATNSARFTTDVAPVQAPREPVVTVENVTEDSITVRIEEPAVMSTARMAVAAAPLATAPVTYTITISAGGETQTATVVGPGTHTFTGLDSSTGYALSVVGSNAGGTTAAVTSTVVTAAEEEVAVPPVVTPAPTPTPVDEAPAETPAEVPAVEAPAEEVIVTIPVIGAPAVAEAIDSSATPVAAAGELAATGTESPLGSILLSLLLLAVGGALVVLRRKTALG